MTRTHPVNIFSYDWPDAVSVVIAFLSLALFAHAGEIEPRSFSNAPVGINFLIAGYAHSEGGLSTVASSLPITYNFGRGVWTAVSGTYS